MARRRGDVSESGGVDDGASGGGGGAREVEDGFVGLVEGGAALVGVVGLGYVGRPLGRRW